MLIAPRSDPYERVYAYGSHEGWVDSRATLDAEVSNLHATAELFDPLTSWLNVEPLTMRELTPGHPLVDTKANQIVDISRAEALACSNDRRKFLDALQRAFPELVEGGM